MQSSHINQNHYLVISHFYIFSACDSFFLMDVFFYCSQKTKEQVWTNWAKISPLKLLFWYVGWVGGRVGWWLDSNRNITKSVKWFWQKADVSIIFKFFRSDLVALVNHFRIVKRDNFLVIHIGESFFCPKQKKNNF